jgi:hypothetical protein
MVFNINEMIASIDQNGVHQTNRFAVQLAPPPVLNGATISSANNQTSITATSDATQLITLRGCGARIPDVLIQTQDVNRFGIGVLEKMPYNVGFTETELTFITDKTGVIFSFFYAWMNSIFDFAGIASGAGTAFPQYLVEYKDNFAVDLRTWIYDNQGNIINCIVMRQAFPIAMADVALDWEDNNRLVKLSVRMPFTNWYYDGTSIDLPALTSPTMPGVSTLSVTNAIPQ